MTYNTTKITSIATIASKKRNKTWCIVIRTEQEEYTFLEHDNDWTDGVNYMLEFVATKATKIERENSVRSIITNYR